MSDSRQILLEKRSLYYPRGENGRRFSLFSVDGIAYITKEDGLQKPIGSGSYGAVYHAYPITPGETMPKLVIKNVSLKELAKKHIKLKDGSSYTEQDLRQMATKMKQYADELKLEAKMNKNVDGIGELHIFNHEEARLILLEQPSSIAKLLTSKALQIRSLLDFLNIFIPILDAYKNKLLSKEIVHGDLSKRNICFDQKKSIASFCDYGFSRMTGELTNGRADGTFPPELQKNERIKAHPSQDIFALGILFFSMNKAEKNDFDSISQEYYIKDDFINLVKTMMSDDPMKRPQIHKIIKKCEKIRKFEKMLLEDQDSNNQSAPLETPSLRKAA